MSVRVFPLSISLLHFPSAALLTPPFPSPQLLRTSADQPLPTLNTITRRAVLIKNGKSDTAKDLYIGETDVPKLKPGWVLVNVKAFGINRMDISQRKGAYPLPPGASEILGVEFSGIVSDVGDSTEWKVGDEVFGLATGGAYAEYIAVPKGMVTLKPAGVSWVKAAAIPENWLTAYQALFLIAGLKEGQNVLVHAGASGVGLAAIQLAKSFGAKLVVATAGTDEKVKFVTAHGAVGVNYKTQDFSEEVAKLTEGNGVNIVIDFIGQSYWEKNFKSLARDGRMVCLALMSGAKTDGPLDMSPILFKRLRIEGSTLRARPLEYQTHLLQEFSKNALEKVFHKCQGREEGLDLVIHKVYDWKDIVEAHEEMEQAKNIGKIICEISS